MDRAKIERLARACLPTRWLGSEIAKMEFSGCSDHLLVFPVGAEGSVKISGLDLMRAEQAFGERDVVVGRVWLSEETSYG